MRELKGSRGAMVSRTLKRLATENATLREEVRQLRAAVTLYKVVIDRQQATS